MNKTPILYCTVGLPFSGKKEWAQCQGLPVVSLAANEVLLSAKAGNKKAAINPLEFTQLMIKSLFKAGNRVIVLLANNLTKEDREYWQASNKGDWQCVFRTFEMSEKEVMRKAIAAGVSKQELAKFREMVKSYEALTE